MPEPITKHAFVDDNPYIAYTGEPETAVSGGSGGGGVGGSGIPTIRVISTDYTCNYDYETLKAAILSGEMTIGAISELTSGLETAYEWTTEFCQTISVFVDEDDTEKINFPAGEGFGYYYTSDGSITYYD